MADTLDPFFRKVGRDSGNVDLLQQKVLDSEINE